MPKKVLMRHSITKMQKTDGSERNVVEVNLYDEIVGSDVWSNYFASEGWAVNAKSFEQSLVAALDGQDLTKVDLVTKINCYGGVVDEGVAMFNILRNYSGKVALLKTQCIASAASSASVVFLAGDEREVCLGAEVMIHEASYGYIPYAVNADDLDALGQHLRRTSDRIAKMYVERTGIDLDEVKAMMKATTYLDAAAAVEKGFATAKSSDKAVASVGNADLMKMSVGVRNVSAGIQFSGMPSAQAPVPPSGMHRIALSALSTLGLGLGPELNVQEGSVSQAQLDDLNEKLEATTMQATAFQAVARAAKLEVEALEGKILEINSAHTKALQDKDAAHVQALEQERTQAEQATEKAVDQAVRDFALKHHIKNAPEMPPPESNQGAPRGAVQIYAQQIANLFRSN
jgi:ATP-dependent protease ClpP protease subunit